MMAVEDHIERSFLDHFELEYTFQLVKKTETNDRGDPLRWPRNTLYPQKLPLLRQQAAVARGPKPRSFFIYLSVSIKQAR
jgi:hypothetical protein